MVVPGTPGAIPTWESHSVQREGCKLRKNVQDGGVHLISHCHVQIFSDQFYKEAINWRARRAQSSAHLRRKDSAGEPPDRSPGPTGSSRAVLDTPRKGPQLPAAPGLDRPHCQRQPVLLQPLNQQKVWAPAAAPPVQAFPLQGPSPASPRHMLMATPAIPLPGTKCRKPGVMPHSEVLLPSLWRGPSCRSHPVHYSHQPLQ